eukprot:2909145-Ditylum_brightwellii.AAC.1
MHLHDGIAHLIEAGSVTKAEDLWMGGDDRVVLVVHNSPRNFHQPPVLGEFYACIKGDQLFSTHANPGLCDCPISL